MADPGSFEIEEHKAAQEEIVATRKAISRLELATIAGLMVAIFVLLKVAGESNVPLFLWWAIAFLVVAAGFRCWIHYAYIARIQRYILEIEAFMRSSGYYLAGFQTFNRTKVIGRVLSFVVNVTIWLVVIASVVLLAIFKTIGRPIP